MKRFFSYISTVSIALLALSCQRDLTETVYNAESATAAEITTLEESYTLDVQKSDEVALTLKWSEPDMGYSASVVNNVEMDVVDENFKGKITLGSINRGGELSITHMELNSKLLGMLESYELEVEPVEIEFRVASIISEAVDPLYSNVVVTTITPFVGERVYPFIVVRGDYNGWDFDKSQKLYSANSDDSYAGLIFFDGKAVNGWKLCGTADWSENWGKVEDEDITEAPLVTLVAGGGNISDYSKNSYRFEFDKSTCEFKVVASYDSWGVVGAHNGWGDSSDVEMILSSEVSDTGTTEYFLTATIDFEAGGEWKIRPDSSWSGDVGPGAVDGEFDEANGNFVMNEAGNYTIKWYFNKVKQVVAIVKN